MIQRRVLTAFEEELEKSKLPGYVCSYDDYGEDNYAMLSDETEDALDLPRILPVDESLRRRDHSNFIPEPHARTAVRETVSLSLRQPGETSSDEPFGAGII
jgi:stage V sporulation protein G